MLENDDYIKKAVEENSKVILTWGHAIDTKGKDSKDKLPMGLQISLISKIAFSKDNVRLKKKLHIASTA